MQVSEAYFCGCLKRVYRHILTAYITVFYSCRNVYLCYWKYINMSNNKAVIIVAGGKGLRMKSALPKQFMELAGKPVLMHTIDCFYRFDNEIKIILVLPANHIEFWGSLCDDHKFSTVHEIVSGGATRFHSVLNGLAAVGDARVVAVHDGVRPLVSAETLRRCFDAAQKNGTAVPVMDSVESVRFVVGDKNHAVDRTACKMVQTPQVFDGLLLKSAYYQEYRPFFTDDASVVESYWHLKGDTNQIFLVDGNCENIKITTSFDLEIASLYVTNKADHEG